MTLMDERQMTPQTERKMILQGFQLEADYVAHLRTLDLDEAEWRIRHEHKVMVQHSKRRMEFLLAEMKGEHDL